jgi:hypothetical protein
MSQKIGRNDPCPCGSGKKYKKCCLEKNSRPTVKKIVTPFETFHLAEASSEEARLVREELRKQQPIEPHLDFVKSIVFRGYRWRPIYQRLHYRPLQETFHEFLIDILKQTFGKEWRQQQLLLSEGSRHILLQWVEAYRDWRKAHETEENKEDEHTWGAEPSGEVFALHQFAYDIYCLQAIHKLPDAIVNRLKNNKEFQGARYEVAVAAIIARAGFEITFLDDKEKSTKHCEFIAKNRYTKEEIGVEAKSRRRRGVLNETGDVDEKAVLKGDVYNLVADALKQRPEGIPYVIFIDLNVMPTPGIPLEQKSWFSDIKGVVDKIKEREKDGRAVENAVVITNFAYYYAGNTGGAPPGETLFLVPLNPQVSIKNPAILQEIFNSVDRYSVIPREV